MRPAEPAAVADVCLIVEGTYPYVTGGVSSWVHTLISSLPELGFLIVHISAEPGERSPRYRLPLNVVGLRELCCRPPEVDPREARRPARGTRVLSALRRLHLGEDLGPSLVADLAARDLSLAELLHGRRAFELIEDVCGRTAVDAPFLDLFWQFRSMDVPLVHLLATELPRAGCYHAVSAGYAGIVGAVASARHGRPSILTEHGLYAHERDIELARWAWKAQRPDGGEGAAQLRRLWSRFFLGLSRLAYAQASSIVTISAVNRARQIADGARPDRVRVVPNGVEVPRARSTPPETAAMGDRPAALRVGFVGRVVAIKDVITFIRACDLAAREAPLDVRVIGPLDEEPAYFERCQALAQALGRDALIRFVGPQPAASLYRDLDVVVLTSISEGQPLVMLEAFARGIPAIATDVGACRELIEGADAEDRALGRAGIVTRLAAPGDTAAALIELARDPGLRQQLGDTGRRRVRARYQRSFMVDAYRRLYDGMTGAWRGSAGSSIG
jgi:glycosyltransferase involved in cell wall biosynthesis